MKVNWDMLSHRVKVGQVGITKHLPIANLLFDFEMQALFNHSPSTPALQPKQTVFWFT